VSTVEQTPEQKAAKQRLEAAFEELGQAMKECEAAQLDPSEYLDPGRLMQLLGMG
jgi:hypothetical protein